MVQRVSVLRSSRTAGLPLAGYGQSGRSIARLAGPPAVGHERVLRDLDVARYAAPGGQRIADEGTPERERQPPAPRAVSRSAGVDSGQVRARPLVGLTTGQERDAWNPGRHGRSQYLQRVAGDLGRP